MTNVSEELARLAALRDQGVLSEDEFAKQKAAVLAGTSPAPVPKKKGSMLRNGGIGCLVIIGILIVLGVIGSMGKPGSAGRGNAAAGPAVTDAPAPLKVSAVELARAYEANEARAQSDYGNRPLLVTGTVDGIDLDLVDDPKVKLRTQNEFLSAQATLVDADKPKARDLSKGQKITLLCQGVSEVISIPMLASCAIQ
ncbi:MAG: SHOCT domain-containing protein [Sphingomonas sp.]|jgi:hypothetical protein|uniref:OB-fold protein n=1 Tax=Sphingomonas sp. TaxID=28214 RepID=UPI00356945EC